jgi:hypothetical protein
MNSGEFFRGGTNLKPRPREVRVDPLTGLVQPTHGISVYSRPDNLDQFGGPDRVSQLPAKLRIIQRGRDPFHHEIAPAYPMPLDEYEEALGRIQLTRVS